MNLAHRSYEKTNIENEEWKMIENRKVAFKCDFFSSMAKDA